MFMLFLGVLVFYWLVSWQRSLRQIPQVSVNMVRPCLIIRQVRVMSKIFHHQRPKSAFRQSARRIKIGNCRKSQKAVAIWVAVGY